MADDLSLADLTRTDNPALANYQFAGTESPVAIAFKKRAAELGVDPNMPIGPGGRNAQGLPYSWLPYDPLQGTSGIGQGDSHTKFGPTYDDPVWGKLQSTYTEPSKSKAARDKASMLAFAAAVAAISGGAGSTLLGPAFSAATKYGTTGSFDPRSLALSAAMSMVPGGLGAIGGMDPALAQALGLASKAYGLGSAGYQASRGNYTPAAGIGLSQLTRGG